MISAVSAAHMVSHTSSHAANIALSAARGGIHPGGGTTAEQAMPQPPAPSPQPTDPALSAVFALLLLVGFVTMIIALIHEGLNRSSESGPSVVKPKDDLDADYYVALILRAFEQSIRDRKSPRFELYEHPAVVKVIESEGLRSVVMSNTSGKEVGRFEVNGIYLVRVLSEAS